MNFLSGLGRTFSGKSNATVDYDEEGRQLWAKLNLENSNRSASVWNPADPIWRHPTGNGIIYVGNQTAAENITYLKSLGITHVVNCTYGFSKIPNFHEGKINYYNFPISHWSTFVNSSDESVIEFSKPMFDFIDNAIANGGSVLIHCLAGAHRAGTTGCACLVHFAKMDVVTAIGAAKRCRSIIDPIGQLPEFLKRLKKAYDSHPDVSGSKYPPVAPGSTAATNDSDK